MLRKLEEKSAYRNRLFLLLLHNMSKRNKGCGKTGLFKDLFWHTMKTEAVSFYKKGKEAMYETQTLQK